MNLTKNFVKERFACKCGCGYNVIQLHFVQRLQLIRDEVGFPMRVTSGCRCPVWNKHEGGTEKSAHVKGEAADIACTNSYQRFMIIAVAIALGFKRFGISKNFIHLDMGEDLPHPRIWVY